ncbi:MAG: NAD(P) transhydrogenase subunit alpha [Firmicutes bacterium]|jgi:NAD(P) transhydrogenase subunit alpha|uniref:proton-translocating NAD(P)(+) transhydrogenase n=1 Tax=Sulfobacillus benefaciens TaxID=453960 RepID=A0A2T2XBF9_9FIRM|nr:NAD(P) transhydrogenase subunit alpha [Bacillota bacterium]MCL5012449.1 NAD(P) transhydrogenase subunit alpha [Bacillota bacterium]PSR31829.1 MAG: pyridine nucleotide transhydrogenase [Sulfobacillus benefaciens]HBQ94203.1 pyridine nucleotide transhydrogenase [Sulfobacillus sp.]
MLSHLLIEVYIFVLAVFVGFQLISKVPSVLHTPLMSATNAIHGVILVGAIALASSVHGTLDVVIAVAAVFLATLNVVGGYVVTDRILGMFKTKSAERPTE